MGRNNGGRFNRGGRGGGRFRGGRSGGRYNNFEKSHNFNRFRGNSKVMEGGRDKNFSSQNKVNSNNHDDRDSRIAKANYEKNNKLFSNKNTQKSVGEISSSNVVSSDASRHQAQILTIPNLQDVKKNPKVMPKVIEMFSNFETYLVNACGTANIDNSFVTAALHRSEVRTVHNGEERVTMEYRMKEYKTIVPDGEKAFNVLVQAAPLTAEALQRQNDLLHQQFQEELAARFLEYEEEREKALQEWSSNIFLTTRAWPESDEDFIYPEFEVGQPVVLENASATIDEVVVDENNKASVVSKPNLIMTSMKLKHMSDQQKDQSEVKSYLQTIHESNKLARKCQAKHDSDVVKVISIIKAALSQDVQEALENHLKIKYDTTISHVIASSDPASLMKHIAAVADILYLESTSEEQTKELLGTIVNYYRSIDKMTRNKWETYSSFFARFANSLRVIKQCALLLNDSTLTMSEEHAVKTLIECTKVDPNHHDLHSYTQSLKTKANQKKATVVEQIIEMTKFIGDADDKIKAEHHHHKDNERKSREKTFFKKNQSRQEKKRDRDGAETSHIEANDSSVYFSVQDLLNEHIDPATIEKLTKSSRSSASTKPGQATPLAPTSSAPASATSSAPKTYVPRGAKSTGRGGMSYNPSSRVVTASGTTGRFINADTHFNEDFEDLSGGIFTDDDEVSCTCISTCYHQSSRKRQASDDIDGMIITKFHHDDGNSSYHCINSRKNLRYVRRPNRDFISSMSGISPGWTTQHEFVGIHPLLGLVAYNPSYRVSLINPNILINDGWQLFTFSGAHGDIVKVYHKMFQDVVHTLEFIMNRHGQLIASDPADDPNFQLPPSEISEKLGSMPRLREYLYSNYEHMIDEYKSSRDDFFHSTIQQFTDSQSSAQANFEGVEDESKSDENPIYANEGRHPYHK